MRVRININMNDARKYIWSLYILLWIYFIFFDSSWDQNDHISLYLIIGWIPFLAVSWIWGRNNQSAASQTNSDDLKQYELLFQIINKDDVLKILQVGKDARIWLEDEQRKLEDFKIKTGKDPDLIESNGKEFLKLSLEEMTEFETLRNSIRDFKLTVDFVEEYSQTIEEINKKLNAGISQENAKKVLDNLIAGLDERKQKARVNLIHSRIIGEELIKMATPIKKRNPKASVRELEKLTVNSDIIKKRLKEEVEEEFGVRLDG